LKEICQSKPHKKAAESSDPSERPMASSRAAAVLAVLAVLAVCQATTSVTLVKDGKATSVIVVPDAASELETFAAEEIARLTLKATGAKLAILTEVAANQTSLAKLFVGNTTAAASAINVSVIPAEAAIVHVVPELQCIYLVGGDVDSVRDLPVPLPPTTSYARSNATRNASRMQHLYSLEAVPDDFELYPPASSEFRREIFSGPKGTLYAAYEFARRTMGAAWCVGGVL
jgi:hypothetical protein